MLGIADLLQRIVEIRKIRLEGDIVTARNQHTIVLPFDQDLHRLGVDRFQVARANREKAVIVPTGRQECAEFLKR